MKNAIHIVVILLIATWAIAYMGFGVTGYIHILLLIAIVIILQKIIGKGKPTN